MNGSINVWLHSNWNVKILFYPLTRYIVGCNLIISSIKLFHLLFIVQKHGGTLVCHLLHKLCVLGLKPQQGDNISCEKSNLVFKIYLRIKLVLWYIDRVPYFYHKLKAYFSYLQANIALFIILSLEGRSVTNEHLQKIVTVV